jgi:mannose-1-phosphate guanylyltransferase
MTPITSDAEASPAPQRAFLLAAGLGSRLRPMTEHTPKCLLPIAGRPLLAYWFDLLERHGYTDVLINLHHLPEQVEAYVASTSSPLRIETFHEPTLLGSAGTVRANRAFISDNRPFLIAYADNFTSADLSALMAFHLRHRPLLTVGLFETPEPTRSGIVEIDRDGLIVGFEEKPAHPRSNLANAGLYIAEVGLFDRLPTDLPSDFGRHILPMLVGDMRGFLLREPLTDIGTLASYKRVQREVNASGPAQQEVRR